MARETIAASDPHLRDAIAPYRAGYTAEQRRELERRLAAGELRAVVATNALELGIDIGLLDCAISIGFPGTVASLRQQWGRAGRSGEGLAVLVASADALDQYFIRHPGRCSAGPSRRRSSTTPAPRSAPAPRVRGLRGADHGGRRRDPRRRRVRRRAAAGGGRPPRHAGRRGGRRGEFPAGHVALRSSSRESVAIVDTDTGRSSAPSRAPAPSTVHEGAIYLHLGEPTSSAGSIWSSAWPACSRSPRSGTRRSRARR